MNLGIQEESYSSDVDTMMMDIVKMNANSATVNFGSKSNKESRKGLLEIEDSI